jgi:hypothetical protein
VAVDGQRNIEVLGVVAESHSQDSLSDVTAITEDVVLIVAVWWNTDGVWAEVVEIDAILVQNQVFFKFVEIVFVQGPNFDSVTIEDQESVVEGLSGHETEIVDDTLEGVVGELTVISHDVDLRRFLVSVGGDGHDDLLGSDDLGIDLVSATNGMGTMLFTGVSNWVAGSFDTGTPDQRIVTVDQNNLIVVESVVTSTFISSSPGDSNWSLGVSDSGQHLRVVRLNMDVKSISVDNILFLESEKLFLGGIEFDVTDVVSDSDLVPNVLQNGQTTGGGDSTVIVGGRDSDGVGAGVVSTFNEVKWLISDQHDLVVETGNSQNDEVSIVDSSLLDLVVHGSLGGPIQISDTWVGVGNTSIVDNSSLCKVRKQKN